MYMLQQYIPLREREQKRGSHRRVYADCFHLRKVKRGKINNILFGSMGIRLQRRAQN